MKLSDSNNIYVGSTPVTKIMLGDTKVWPNQSSFILDYSIDYMSNWGQNQMNDGDHKTLNGSRWFIATDTIGANITYNCTWSFTGNVTLQRTITTDTGDPRGDNLPLYYKYNVTGTAELIVTYNGETKHIYFN